MLLLLPAVAIAADAPPDWAYPVAPANFQPPPDNGQPKHVAGSTKTFTEKDINDSTNPPDWFPDEHPPMPQLVAHGKAPVVHACDQCHLTTGRGHPESGNLAGLPAGYIQEQIAEFRNGSRKSSLAGRSANMIMFASALTDEEVKEAAQYFASIKPAVWNKVVETTTVPKTYVGEGNMRFASEGNAKEPIGRRIIKADADRGKNVLYSVFADRPKHLDPVQSYTSDEAVFTRQVYEPPLQYHYLKRPYELIPLTAEAIPAPRLVTSWAQYERWYGGYTPRSVSFLPWSVQGFFQNGGAAAAQ